MHTDRNLKISTFNSDEDLNGIVGHAFGVEDLLESSGEGKHLLNGTLSMKSENTAEQYLVQNLDYR